MSRPYKLNDTPTAPFSLREHGPMKLTEITRRLKGKTFRTARGVKVDGRATVDPKPCPHCHSLVEWATTGKRNSSGGFDRYVYARCRGNRQHRWSFNGMESNPTPPRPPTVSQIEKALAEVPATGSYNMDAWVNKRMLELNMELAKLEQFKTLAHEVLHIPDPQASVH